MYRIPVSIFVVVIATALSGCRVMDAGNEFIHGTWQLFRPKPTDFRDGTSEEADSDEWSIVGELGRGDQERERDPDPWWQNHVMSPKARSIERNLGID